MNPTDIYGNCILNIVHKWSKLTSLDKINVLVLEINFYYLLKYYIIKMFNEFFHKLKMGIGHRH